MPELSHRNLLLRATIGSMGTSRLTTSETKQHGSSFTKGLSVLDAFSAGESVLSLTQIAQRAGLPKSTAHRLVNDLIAWGGLERTSVGIRLGIRLFELGRSVPVQLELADVARPFLEDLYNITNRTVNLAVLDKDELVYIEKLEAPDARTVSRTGRRYPLHCTALGKSILAFSPPQLCNKVIERGLAPMTDHTITDGAQLRRELASIRNTHVSFDREEFELGLYCISTPILDDTGALAAAISVASLQSITGARSLTPALLTISRAISRELTDHSGAVRS